MYVKYTIKEPRKLPLNLIDVSILPYLLQSSLFVKQWNSVCGKGTLAHVLVSLGVTTVLNSVISLPNIKNLYFCYRYIYP